MTYHYKCEICRKKFEAPFHIGKNVQDSMGLYEERADGGPGNRVGVIENFTTYCLDCWKTIDRLKRSLRNSGQRPTAICNPES